MTFKSGRTRMKYALVDLLVDLGITILTTSNDKRTRMLKRCLPLRALLEEAASYMSHLWLCAVSFPTQYVRGFGEIVCHCPRP